MIGKIVAASDCSETATRAVVWAAELARRFEAELVVVNAGGDRRSLEAHVNEHAPGARARIVGGGGEREIAAAIVQAAEEEEADVLVVGNLGMSGRKEFLLHNVPNRVSHLARCTVVIVNTAEAAEDDEGFQLPWRT